MRSMTGYGSGRAALGGGHVVLDVRTVNHRYLDVRARLPTRIQSRTPTVERVVRARVQRGRVDVAARFEGETLPQPTLDIDRARSLYRELTKLRDELNPGEPVPLGVLSSVPDLFVIHRELDQEALDDALVLAAEEACDAVTAMREAEGAALATELRKRLDDVDGTLTSLEAALPDLVEARRVRLRGRLEALLSDTETGLDPSRLEQEVALIADRLDVAEEVVRLRSHRTQMLELTHETEAPVGKRIDFLLQEMTREANTIGSKVQDGTVTPHVIALKSAVEQMREQAQNVL